MSDFQSHTGIEWQGNVGVVQYGGGVQRQLAIFYNKPVHNPLKSREAGRPIYENRVYVRVAPPGERLNVVDRPATRQDQALWPQQWAAFNQNKDQVPEGTPIEQLYPDKPAIAATLRASNVVTIEQLAELSAHAIENVGMGSQSWVNSAKKYVEQSQKGVAIVQHRRDLEERDGQIRVLNQQIEMLKQQVSALQANNQANGLSVADIQKMIAAAQIRPEMPAANKVTGPNFDPSTAQINANRQEIGLGKPRKSRVKV